MGGAAGAGPGGAKDQGVRRVVAGMARGTTRRKGLAGWAGIQSHNSFESRYYLRSSPPNDVAWLLGAMQSETVHQTAVKSLVVACFWRTLGLSR